MDTMEVLKLKLLNTQLQAQSFEQYVVVLDYARLLREVQDIQQDILKLEEEMRQNEINQSNPVYPPDPGRRRRYPPT